MNWLESLAKVLPVEEIYKDVAQPSFREIGDIARNTIHASRFILAPIDYLSAQQDRWQNWLKKISENVPIENQIPAHPQISGPILEHLRYLEENNLLAELFINLLSRAIDRERVNEAHPAFVNIISQISPDEAKMIFHFSKKKQKIIQHAKWHEDAHLFDPRTTISNEFPITELFFPENYFMYIDHLHSLNIAGMWQSEEQEILKENNIQTGVNITSKCHLTQFGELFAKACLPEKLQ